MEIILELLFWAIAPLLEALFQAILALISECAVHFFRKRFPRRTTNKLLQNTFVLLFFSVFSGLFVGIISLQIIPHFQIDSQTWRILNLLITPLCVGGIMSLMGLWRKSRDQEPVYLNHFIYGFTFACALNLVRLFFCK